ncbi:MAG: 6-phosphogluconolactonase [Deltaproteobacteria bacterium]|nr:6-phosphogluconolactonase [Deltaproteobacteria bacterium]
MDFPNLEIVRAENLQEIGLKTARIIRTLSSGGTVAVSGGTTYRKVLNVWQRTLGPFHVKLFPVDERMVPFDTPESNWGMVQDLLLDPLDWPESKRCFVEKMSERAADDYEKLLRLTFNQPMPEFDLIFLGVGGDGHTASLFPGTPHLNDYESWVLQTQSPNPPKERITLGMGVICRARQVVIIVMGEGKRSVVEAMRRGDQALPIVRVLKSSVKKLLFLDRDAASTVY